MKYPTYLEGHIKDYKDKFLSTMTLCDKNGSEKLDIYYYGSLVSVKREKQKYITDAEKPMLIVARDCEDEEFVIYDGTENGYDNMFCNLYDFEQKNREVKKLELDAQKFILELGYSIDYDEEKEEYDYDEDENVLLIDGRSISFEDMKRDGYDYLALSYVDKYGEVIQFVDVELA